MFPVLESLSNLEDEDLGYHLTIEAKAYGGAVANKAHLKYDPDAGDKIIPLRSRSAASGVIVSLETSKDNVDYQVPANRKLEFIAVVAGSAAGTAKSGKIWYGPTADSKVSGTTLWDQTLTVTSANISLTEVLTVPASNYLTIEETSLNGTSFVIDVIAVEKDA